MKTHYLNTLANAISDATAAVLVCWIDKYLKARQHIPGEPRRTYVANCNVTRGLGVRDYYVIDVALHRQSDILSNLRWSIGLTESDDAWALGMAITAVLNGYLDWNDLPELRILYHKVQHIHDGQRTYLSAGYVAVAAGDDLVAISSTDRLVLKDWTIHGDFPINPDQAQQSACEWGQRLTACGVRNGRPDLPGAVNVLRPAAASLAATV